MKIFKINKLHKKIAMVLSLCLLIVWMFLGTGASLAWFSDSSPEINNIFHFADFKLEVSHQLANGSWESIDGKTDVFDKEALYEPGYVQTVYLRVKNTGDRNFKFSTAVNVNGCSVASNVLGGTFKLQDYLKFGITVSDTLEEMKNSVSDRQKAAKIANLPLQSTATEPAKLAPGQEAYIALIVRMPEDLNNVANYRGNTIPKVELGITARAEQIK